jgi:HAD superfamily hydrolase (TIGR01509 family)
LGLFDIERLRHERNALYSQLLRQAPLFIEGVAEALETLSKKYIMGMVTSSRRDHLDLIYQTTDLLQYFTFVIAGDDCANLKPHPEPYLRAVEKSGHPPELCLAIEDSERGLASASAAGIRCVVVPNELTRGGNFTGADKVLSNLSQLVTIL